MKPSKRATTSTPSHTLPELPKTKKHHEANWTPVVLNWFRENYNGNCAIEVKVSKNNKTVPRSAVALHQILALSAVKKDPRGFAYKISDESRRQLPFDAFFLKFAEAFIVCVFPRHGVAIAVNPLAWQGIDLGLAMAHPEKYSSFAIHLRSKASRCS